MKKLILFLILLLFIVGCKEIPEKEVPEEKVSTLSELQVSACNAADEAGTCQTRLVEVGIIMPSECCEVLGKCCKNE